MTRDDIIGKFRDRLGQRSILRKVEPLFEAYISIALLFVIGTIIFVNITIRTVSGGQLAGSLTIVLGLIAWMSWFATAYGVRSRSHLRFTLLRNKLSMRSNYAIYWFEWALWLVTMGIIFWFGLQEMLVQMGQNATIVGLGWPRWILVASIPITAVATIIRVLQQVFIVTREYRNEEDIKPEISIGE